MNRSRPAIINKCKPHVEATTGHYILCSDALAAQVLNKQMVWHHTRDMSPIYSPYAVLEVRIEPPIS
jgi:hypothetical protein